MTLENRLVSEVADRTGTLVSQGDLVSFFYGIPGVEVTMEIGINNGKFMALAKDNDPLSCLLDELKPLVGEYEIIGNVFDSPELKII